MRLRIRKYCCRFTGHHPFSVRNGHTLLTVCSRCLKLLSKEIIPITVGVGGEYVNLSAAIADQENPLMEHKVFHLLSDVEEDMQAVFSKSVHFKGETL